MAETKLTAEQIAEQLSDDVITVLHEATYEAGEIDGDSQDKISSLCANAINDYAAQQQAEHERMQEEIDALNCELGNRGVSIYERRLSEVLAVLREHEWVHGYDEGDWYCVACDEPKSDGHTANCWYAALLAADKEKGNES